MKGRCRLQGYERRKSLGFQITVARRFKTTEERKPKSEIRPNRTKTCPLEVTIHSRLALKPEMITSWKPTGEGGKRRRVTNYSETVGEGNVRLAGDSKMKIQDTSQDFDGENGAEVRARMGAVFPADEDVSYERSIWRKSMDDEIASNRARHVLANI